MTPEEVMARVATLLRAAQPAPADQTRGAAVVVVAREGVLDALRTLRDDAQLGLVALSDLTAVDYLGREPRFEVVYELNSLTHHHRLRVKAGVPGDDPTIASATPLWNAALRAEGEVRAISVIRVMELPDVHRTLMTPELGGLPLRKDYPVNRRQPLVPERDPVREPWYPRADGR